MLVDFDFFLILKVDLCPFLKLDCKVYGLKVQC